MSSPETTLQMAQRHVAEGQERISRQEALITKLTLDGHDRMLPDANALLDQLREVLAMSEAHLARLVFEGLSSSVPN